MRIILIVIVLTLSGVLKADATYPPPGFCSDSTRINNEGGYYLKKCSSKDSSIITSISSIESGSYEFCSKFISGSWELIPLELEHYVKRDEAKEYIPIGDRTTRVYPKAGYFDINNDGIDEYIGQLRLHSGAGRGCDIEILVEMDNQLTHIKGSGISKSLKDFSCGKYHRPFKYDGKTYIETRRLLMPFGKYGDTYNTLVEIYIIENELKNTLCTFKTDSRNEPNKAIKRDVLLALNASNQKVYRPNNFIPARYHRAFILF